MFNESLWLFVAGISLLGAFIAWLNTDGLMNRKILLKQQRVQDLCIRANDNPACSDAR